MTPHHIDCSARHYAREMRKWIAEYRRERDTAKSHKSSLRRNLHQCLADNARNEVFQHGAMKRRYQRAMP